MSRNDNKRPNGVHNAVAGSAAIAWLGTTRAPTRWLTRPGQVVNDAEQKKIDKYTDQSMHYQFVPITIETLGPVGDEATAFFHELGRRIVAVTSEPRTMSFLWQRLLLFRWGTQHASRALNIGHMTQHFNLNSR